MKTYRITNRITRETHEVQAAGAQAACRLLGWLIGNCHVEDLTQVRTKALEEVAWASHELALALRAGDADAEELRHLRTGLPWAVRRALRQGCAQEEVGRAQVRLAEEAA